MTLMTNSRKKGFTLLELLIVITILAILTLVVVLFINPVEILKKSRDVQRMSDLSTMKTAIALYLQDSSSNNLGSTTYCASSVPAAGITDTATSNKIRMSLGATAAAEKTSAGTARYYTATTTADIFNNNGKGWIPYINFSTFTGGAPVEKIPADPINTGGSGGTEGLDSLYYRYACKTNNTFELDATLESAAYGVAGTDPKTTTDGGNSGMRFEVGTDLNILASTAPLFANPLP